MIHLRQRQIQCMNRHLARRALDLAVDTEDPTTMAVVSLDEDGKAMADLITMADEQVETLHGITLFDPIETWKECTYVNCTAR